VGLRVRSGDGWDAWTRRDIATEVDARVTALTALGLRPAETVAILAGTSAEWYLTALAIQIAGGVLVGVYPTSAPDQIRHVISHAGCRIAFAGDRDLLEAVASVRSSCPSLQHTLVFGSEAGNAPSWPRLVDAHRIPDNPLDRLEHHVRALDPDQVCTIIYTSGTTGEPKGAMHSFRTIGQIERSVAPALGYRDTDEYLSFLPMSHTAEQQNTLVLGSAIGWTLNFSTLDRLFDDLPAIRPSVMFAVPRVLEKLRGLLEATDIETDGALARAGLDRLRVLLAGGAPLDREVLAAFARHGIQIRNGYGMTEGSGIAMPWATAPRVDTVGTPLPGVQIRLAADGEILVRSSGVCLGYYNDAAATQAMCTDDGYLHTGDVGKFTHDGELQIVGRKKEIIITKGGKNMAPAGLEAKLTASPLIQRAVVIGNDRPYLVALIEPTPDAGFDDISEHVDAVNSTLSRPEQVKQFAVTDRALDEIPRALTPTQKLRRHVVEAAFANLIEELYSRAPQRS